MAALRGCYSSGESKPPVIVNGLDVDGRLVNVNSLGADKIPVNVNDLDVNGN